jgi:hypothetical protein
MSSWRRGWRLAAWPQHVLAQLAERVRLPFAQYAAEGHCQIGVFAQHSLEIGLSQHPQSAFLYHPRGADVRFAGQQGHFAAEIPGLQCLQRHWTMRAVGHQLDAP